MKDYLDIIKAPVITEKSSSVASNDTKYVFKVDPRANKIQIKQINIRTLIINNQN